MPLTCAAGKWNLLTVWKPCSLIVLLNQENLKPKYFISKDHIVYPICLFAILSKDAIWLVFWTFAHDFLACNMNLQFQLSLACSAGISKNNELSLLYDIEYIRMLYSFVWRCFGLKLQPNDHEIIYFWVLQDKYHYNLGQNKTKCINKIFSALFFSIWGKSHTLRCW